MKKILLVILIINSMQSYSQLNYLDKGQKALYWGISIGVNTTDFSVDRQPHSILNDTILDISSKMSPGFNLGLISNWQFNRHLDLRFVPNMTFAEKILEYRTENSFIENKTNTIYISLPLLIRYKAEPVNDWRLFVLGGLKYEYNINSQLPNDTEPEKLILKKSGFSAEYGLGIQYFFDYFIFSPEIKFSHSLNNLLDPMQSPLNNSTLKGLFPRALTLSLNFEG